MRNPKRRSKTNAEVIATLDRTHPDWRSLPDGELDKAVAGSLGVAYLTLGRAKGPSGREQSAFFGWAGNNAPPDVDMLKRQLADEQERARAQQVLNGLRAHYRAAVQRRVAERNEARRLRIAGYEMADVRDVAERAAQGRSLTAEEIDQRARERAAYDRDELWRWHGQDLEADAGFRLLLERVERGDDAAITLAAEPDVFDRLCRGDAEVIDAFEALLDTEPVVSDTPLQRARRRLGLAKIRSGA